MYSIFVQFFFFSHIEIRHDVYDIQVSSADLATLNDGQWLSDNIITVCMRKNSAEKSVLANGERLLFIDVPTVRLLKDRNSDMIKAILKPLKPKEHDYIFLPFNDSVDKELRKGKGEKSHGTHWTLFVLDRVQRMLFHFDSQGRRDGPQQNANGDYIYKGFDLNDFFAAVGFTERGSILRSIKCGRQHNSNDCGVHVINNVDLIIQQIEKTGTIQYRESLGIDITAAKIKEKRTQLRKWIDEMIGKKNGPRTRTRQRVQFNQPANDGTATGDVDMADVSNANANANARGRYGKRLTRKTNHISHQPKIISIIFFLVLQQICEMTNYSYVYCNFQNNHFIKCFHLFILIQFFQFFFFFRV